MVPRTRTGSHSNLSSGAVSPVPCFKPFGEAVSIDGDRDVNKAIIADTMKLVRELDMISYVLLVEKK